MAEVIADLVHLVAQLAMAEAVAEGDALEEAERLGDHAEGVDGVVAGLPEQSGAEGAWLAWHGLALCSCSRSSAQAAGQSTRPTTRRRRCRCARRVTWRIRGRRGRARGFAS